MQQLGSSIVSWKRRNLWLLCQTWYFWRSRSASRWNRTKLCRFDYWIGLDHHHRNTFSDLSIQVSLDQFTLGERTFRSLDISWYVLSLDDHDEIFRINRFHSFSYDWSSSNDISDRNRTRFSLRWKSKGEMNVEQWILFIRRCDLSIFNMTNNEKDNFREYISRLQCFFCQSSC